MKCLDDEKEFYGNFDASAASNLMVAFIKCDPTSGLQCKNDTEIVDWLADKYILTLVNEQKYLKQEFNGNHKSSRSHFKWYSASGRARIDYANIIQIMEMKVQDEALYEQN